MKKIFLCMFFGIVNFAPIVVLAGQEVDHETERRIIVSGQCSRSVTPDRAEIQAVADFTHFDIQIAIREATQIYDRTREAIKKLEISDLEVETSEYTVQEVREWEKDRSVLKGYQARMGLKVSTSNIGQIGQVISILADHGVKDVGQLRIFLSSEKLRAEKLSCLQGAAIHARSKAKELADALGVKLGTVISIREQTSMNSPVQQQHFPMAFAAKENSRSLLPPSVESAKQEVSVSVEAVFCLESH